MKSTCSSRSQNLLQVCDPKKPNHFEMMALGESHQISDDNLDGYVLTAVAENKLRTQVIADKLSEVMKQHHFSANDMCYNNFSGLLEFRNAYCAYINRQKFIGTKGTINPANMIINSGLGGVISHLAMVLCEEKPNTILVPLPSYNALPNDFGALARTSIAPMYTNESDYMFTESMLDATLARYPDIRMFFLINPSNPQGFIYSNDMLRMIVRWCRKNRVHLVCDEIYSRCIQEGTFTSIFAVCAEENEREMESLVASTAVLTGCALNGACVPTGKGSGAIMVEESLELESKLDSSPTQLENPNTSSCAQLCSLIKSISGAALSELVEKVPGCISSPTSSSRTSAQFSPLGDYVHILWGFSKDFCMSGMRVGALYTENRELLQIFSNISYFNSVSNLVLIALTKLLEARNPDNSFWIDSFIDGSEAALRAQRDLVMSLLDSLGVPYYTPQAGMFIWMDFRRFLEKREGDGPFCAERRLTQRMFNKDRVLFTPGECCLAKEPGFYRCCFAWVKPEFIKIAFERLKKDLGGSLE